MINERKEPTLSSGAVDAADKRPAQGQVRAPRQQVIVQKQSSGFLWLTFAIALLAATAAGFTAWQWFTAQQTIAQQQFRINQLEQKLVLSDDESTQSLTVLSANVKALDKNVKQAMSEVDKLWGTRNVNKKAIADAKKSLTADIAETQKSFAASLQTVNKPIATIQQRSSEQGLLLQSLRERIAEQNKTVSSLASQSSSYASKKALQAISAKLKAYDEAIDSFDKFRLTINRDLLQIKQRTGLASSN
ncbi:MAG: hypothetical protein AAFZ92_00180 [Pseudomonadota bacterium]